MAQDVDGASNMLEVHVGSTNGFIHDDKQPSFSTDTLLSSVQSADFSPRSDQLDQEQDSARSTSAASSSATRNLDQPSQLNASEIIDITTSLAVEPNPTDTPRSTQTDGSGPGNVMTTSATSSTSGGMQNSSSRFNTITSPSRRLDSFSSSSTTKSKSASAAVPTGKSPLARSDYQNGIEDLNANNSTNSDHDTNSPQRIEDRLNAVRLARERQEAERAKRLAELAEALRQQQSSYEQRRAEMRRMMEERRLREEEHRRQVEIRRRRLFEAEQAKREAILKRMEERDVKVRETRVKSAGQQVEGGGAIFVNGNAKLSADAHRAYSIASLRRGDGARSASCDRHGISNVNLSQLEKSPHRQSSTALATRGASILPPGAPNGIMSVSMICLSPSEKPTSSMSSSPGSNSQNQQQPSSSTAAGRSPRKSRKQQAESSSASHASLHQIGNTIGGSSSGAGSFESQNAARMCASLVNIPEEELPSSNGLTATAHSKKLRSNTTATTAAPDVNSAASKRRLLASRASLVTWQQSLSRRTSSGRPHQSPAASHTTSGAMTSSMYSRYQPRPSSVPARRLRRDAPTMFHGGADAAQQQSPAPGRHRLAAANGASEMTLTASVTAAIMPQPPPSRTSSMRAKSERQLNRLSVMPTATSEGASNAPSKAPKASSRLSLAPSSKQQPSTPSMQRAHPPTKPALLPSAPSSMTSSMTATNSSSSNRRDSAALQDRVDTTLDADAEREYQRKLAEKRRQAREAAAAKKAAEEKAAAPQQAQQPTAETPVNSMEITVPTSSVMACSAPPDIIASALDGDGSSSGSTTSESPQPHQQPSPSVVESSPESAIAVSESTGSEENAPITKSLSRDLTVVVSPPVIVTGADSMLTPPARTEQSESTEGVSQLEVTVKASEPSEVSNELHSGHDSGASSAAVSPPGNEPVKNEAEVLPGEETPKPALVKSYSQQGSPTSERTPRIPGEGARIVRPISGELSGSTTRLTQESVRERLSSLTGSQTNLMSASLTGSLSSSTLKSAATPQVDERVKKQEEERAERKKRLDAIMSRVKPTNQTSTPASPLLTSTGSSQSITPAAHPHLSGPIQSMPVLPNMAQSTPDASSTVAEASMNGSMTSSTSSAFAIPSAEMLLSKIKSEKVQSILASRLAASSAGSKVRFNLGEGSKDDVPPTIGSTIPDLQVSQSPLPRLNSTSGSSSGPSTAAPLLMLSSTTSNGGSESNGGSSGQDSGDDNDSGTEDRKLDEVIRLDSTASGPTAPKQQTSVEAFVN